MPCVNINSDFQLGPGNHVATLYVTDGFNYAADTIRFPVTSAQTVDEVPATSEEGITLTTPKGDPIVREVNLVSEDGITQTDPLEECDVDVSEDTDEDTGGGNGEDGDGSEGLSIDVDLSLIHI